MDIVGRIEQLKNQRGWTDYRLSLESGVPQSTLATIKQRNTPPKFEILEMICNAFGITLSQFFLENENFEILTKEELDIIYAYRKLSEKQKQAILALVKG